MKQWSKLKCCWIGEVRAGTAAFQFRPLWCHCQLFEPISSRDKLPTCAWFCHPRSHISNGLNMHILLFAFLWFYKHLFSCCGANFYQKMAARPTTFHIITARWARGFTYLAHSIMCLQRFPGKHVFFTLLPGSALTQQKHHQISHFEQKYVFQRRKRLTPFTHWNPITTVGKIILY